jgi:hypothetical protein
MELHLGHNNPHEYLKDGQRLEKELRRRRTLA